MIKKYVLRFPLMVGSTAEMAVGTQPVETPDDILVLAHIQQERHSQAIYFHLHIAEEIMRRMQLNMVQCQPIYEGDLLNIDMHIQVLSGDHPSQKEHLEHPRAFPWSSDQSQRLGALRSFSGLLRSRSSRLLVGATETDTASLPTPPHTPPPHAKSA
ncbi:MAG: hypothetical protein AAB855_02810 [Patescibacteria group bacterium]